MKTLQTLLMSSALLGLCSAPARAQAARVDRSMTQAEVIKLIDAASGSVKFYSLYMRAAPVERALMRAATQTGASVAMFTTYNSLHGPADMFANLVYGGYNGENVRPGVTVRLLPLNKAPSNAFMVVDGRYLVTGEFGLPGSRLRVTNDPQQVQVLNRWISAAGKLPTVSAAALYSEQFTRLNPGVARKAQQGIQNYSDTVINPIDIKDANDVLRQERPRR